MRKILIVDDAPERYSGFRAKLESHNLDLGSIDTASNLRDALALLSRSRYEIMIVDMLLPLAPWDAPVPNGGAKVLRHLQEDEELLTPNYIVGITAAAEDDQEVASVFQSGTWVLIRDNGKPGEWEGRLLNLVLHALDVEKQADHLAYDADICIVSALHTPEHDAVLDCDFGWGGPVPIDSNTYVREGRLSVNGRVMRAIAACCSRMGNTESALVTYKLIEKFRPRLVLLSGICAGKEHEVNFGDVVVANPVWDWTSAKVRLDDAGQTVKEPAPDYISIDEEMRARFALLREDRNLWVRLRDEWKGEKPDTVLALRIGACASGPLVVADANIFKDIKEKQNRAVVALEMEAYGVYCAVRNASRPRPLVASVKSVCDFADHIKNDRHRRYAAYTSAGAIYAFLRRYAPELVDMMPN